MFKDISIFAFGWTTKSQELRQHTNTQECSPKSLYASLFAVHCLLLIFLFFKLYIRLFLLKILLNLQSNFLSVKIFTTIKKFLNYIDFLVVKNEIIICWRFNATIVIVFIRLVSSKVTVIVELKIFHGHWWCIWIVQRFSLSHYKMVQLMKKSILTFHSMKTFYQLLIMSSPKPS